MQSQWTLILFTFLFFYFILFLFRFIRSETNEIIWKKLRYYWCTKEMMGEYTCTNCTQFHSNSNSHFDDRLLAVDGVFDCMSIDDVSEVKPLWWKLILLFRDICIILTIPKIFFSYNQVFYYRINLDLNDCAELLNLWSIFILSWVWKYESLSERIFITGIVFIICNSH